MRMIIILFLIVVSTLPSFSQITFTEILFDPSGSESHDEFVEIFNLSYIDSADITGWVLSDTTAVDEILAYRGGNKIPPRYFAVILDASYFDNSTIYDSLIPDSVLILTISNSTFGSGGLSNSKAEYLSICDSSGDTLTTYMYSIGNTSGFSDEKIILYGLNNQDNWRDSEVELGTPGFKNSVSPFNNDAGFLGNSILIPDMIYNTDSIQIVVDVYNLGIEDINADIEVLLYSDRNEDFLFTGNDILIGQHNISHIVTSGNERLVFNWSDLPTGDHLIVAALSCSQDDNAVNNLIWDRKSVLSRSRELHLNEIKFLSFPNEPEWVELINSGSDKIFLKDWAIADTVLAASIDSSVFIYPGQIKIVSAGHLLNHYMTPDSIVIVLENFPSLNNAEDKVNLIGPDGEIVEKIYYTEDWLEGEDWRSVSLERINPNLKEGKSENWGPCITSIGATPGAINSIYSEISEREPKVKVTPNPFSPDYDGFEDYTLISGELPEKSARIKIQIFDIKGRLIQTIKDDQFTGAYFDMVWDGKDNKGRIARMGIYIVYVQALNDREGVLREMKTTVVLAHKL